MHVSWNNAQAYCAWAGRRLPTEAGPFSCSRIRWPGVVPPMTVSKSLVEWIDLAPTLLDAAGVTGMLPAQGRSLLPVLTGDPGWVERDWVLSEYRNSSQPYDPPVHTTMLRRGQHKLVVHHGPPATPRERVGELYDLAADPDELVNLFHDPQAGALRSSLQEALLDVLVATEDRFQPRVADF